MPTCPHASVPHRTDGTSVHCWLVDLHTLVSHCSFSHCPILSHSLFHPVPSSHSHRLRLLSTFPWTIWHAPVPSIPIQTSKRSLQSYSSLRRAASLVRAHTAALPRLRLSHTHSLSLAASRKQGFPSPRTWWWLRRLRRHARQFYHVLLCPCARPGEPSLLQVTPFAGAIHQGE